MARYIHQLESRYVPRQYRYLSEIGYEGAIGGVNFNHHRVFNGYDDTKGLRYDLLEASGVGFELCIQDVQNPIDFALKIVTRNGFAIRGIPSEYLTEKHYIAAIEQCPHSITAMTVFDRAPYIARAYHKDPTIVRYLNSVELITLDDGETGTLFSHFASTTISSFREISS
jgi:hypothetical protein